MLSRIIAKNIWDFLRHSVVQYMSNKMLSYRRETALQGAL